MATHIDQLLSVMHDAVAVLESVSSSAADELRVMKVLQDATSAALSQGLAEFNETRAYEGEDATSTVVWARRELHLDAGEVRQHLRCADAMRSLPQLKDHAVAGGLSGRHVNLFAFSLRHVGRDETAAIEAQLVDYAVSAAPSKLKEKVDEFRARIHPEELDLNWIKGLDKQHISLARLETGWHLTGHLPIDTGVKLKQVLDSLAVPTDAGDTRSAMARRLDGFDRLLSRVLADGLPTDGTVRPQLHVIVEAGTLKAALAPDPETEFTATVPARLVGFGCIGPRLLRYLTGDSDLTPVLVEKIEPNATVLDVGRTHRYATPKQRHAIWIRQNGECATTGCHNSIDHLHHETPWSAGGLTDLDHLTGRCHACHTHLHRHSNGPPPRPRRKPADDYWGTAA